MGWFGPSIGDEKRENGQRFAYGWCDNCLGTGVSETRYMEGTKNKCYDCSGSKQRWYGNLPDGVLSDIYVALGTFMPQRIWPFRKSAPKPESFSPPQSYYDSKGTAECRHEWQEYLRESQKDYRRKCKKCGKLDIQWSRSADGFSGRD